MQFRLIDKFTRTLLSVLLICMLVACIAHSESQERVKNRTPRNEEAEPILNHRSNFTFGSENFSASQCFTGGNYLYLEYGFIFSPALTVSSKFALSFLPTLLEDKLLSLDISVYYLKLQEALNFSLTISYLYNFKYLTTDYGNVGLDFCFIASGPLEEGFDIKVLPLGIFFNLKSYDFAFCYELIKITFRF